MSESLLKITRAAGSSKQQAGVTIIEFAVVVAVFLGVIGFLFEVGIVYFHYSLLTHTTSVVSRRLAANIGTNLSAPALAAEAKHRAEDYFRDALGMSAKQLEFTAALAKINNPDPDKECTLQLEAHWQISCFFCIFIWFDPEIELETRSEALVEDECLNKTHCT